MEELRHALHAAADDPPPTRIDLDQLIDGTRRRSRFQYRVGTLAGLTALTAGAIAVPFVVLPVGGLGSGGGGGAPPHPCPSVSIGPVPSESIGVIAGPPGPPSGIPSESLGASISPSGGPPPPRSGEPSISPSGGPPPPRSGEPSIPRSAGPPPSYRPLREGTPPSGYPAPPCAPPEMLVCASPSRPLPAPSSSSLPRQWKGTRCDLVFKVTVDAVQAESARLADGWTIGEFEVPATGVLVVTMTGPGGATGTMTLEMSSGTRGTPQQACAELAGKPGFQGGTCAAQPEGDVLFVRPAPAGDTGVGNRVFDFRPDGTQVGASAQPPVPMSRLIGFARDRELSAR
jgi:hypothetical protein